MREENKQKFIKASKEASPVSRKSKEDKATVVSPAVAPPPKPAKIKSYTEADLKQLINRIAVQVEKSGKKYDALVCVARGGWVVGTYLSHRLDSSDVISAMAKNLTYGPSMDKLAGQQKVISAQFQQLYRPATMIDKKDIPKYRENPKAQILPTIIKRVLIVDDIVDSGETLKAVIDQVKERGWAYEVAVAVQKPQNVVKIDYYGDWAQTDEWVVFSWESEKSTTKTEAIYGA